MRPPPPNPATVPRDLADLTDLHLLILGALWTSREATIAEIHAAIRHRTDAAPKTIATLLGRLEQRGIVTHRIVGREGVYQALVGKRDVLVARMGGMLGSLFAAEERAVGAAAVGDEVRDGDAERLRALLRRAEQTVVDGR
jgi:BlaI family transcriptional regulator, penicillinase repressor